MLRLIGSIFVATVASLFFGRARRGARPLVGLGALVLLAGAGFATPSASQSGGRQAAVTLSGGTLYVAWETAGGALDPFSLVWIDATYAIARIDGVDYAVEASNYHIDGPPRRVVVHYRRASTFAALPQGTVSRMTVNGQPYVDHAGNRLFLPNLPDPVPTLSEWAMILFGALLAGAAAMTAGRRRTRPGLERLG